MRQGVRLRGLKYVTKPNGNVYVYRRVNGSLIPLPLLPENDPAFLAAYAAAGDAKPKPKSRAGAGSLDALAASYLRSRIYSGLADSTRADRRRVLDRLRVKAGKVQVAAIEPRHVKADLAALEDSPANHRLKCWRALMAHAIEQGWREDDPSAKIPKRKTSGESYHSWTEDEIERFKVRHPHGTKARLMLEMILATGQRISDIAVMGRQHVRNGRISVKQKKTGVALSIPIGGDLRRELDLLPPTQLTFLLTEYDKPFALKGLGQWWRKRCDEAGLNHWSAHGGRHAVGRRLAEAGCTAHEIMAILGHKTLAEAQRYTTAAAQDGLADTAIAKTERKQKDGNSVQFVSKNRK